MGIAVKTGSLQYSKEKRKNMNNAFTTVFGFIFIFLMTTLGSALVFCFRKEFSARWNAIFFGFASGIMLSASIWSLLLPAFEQIAPKWGKISFIPISVSFLSGCVFLMILDGVILLIRGRECEKRTFSSALDVKTRKLFLAVTLHNIPEGLAVGFAFGAARMIHTPTAYTSALLLSIGIGVQNFPEGAALALPLLRIKNKSKAFFFGVLSGLPEPIFAVLGYLLSAQIVFLQPWLLALSAGTMFFVVVDELLPALKSEYNESSSIGAVGAAVGFALMMALDVALG